MCAHKANPYNAVIEVNSDYKPVVISLDVENHSVVTQEACRWIVSFDIARSPPLRVFRFLVPAFQLLFAISMLSPKQSKCTFRNNSHITNIGELFPFWERIIIF